MYNYHRTQTPLANDQLFRMAPSIFAEGKHDSRSERYQYIPTIQVVEELRKEGFYPVLATESKARSEDKKGYTKHMIRFRGHDGFNNVGDIQPELVLVNAHDGTAGYNFYSGLYRYACANGWIVMLSEMERVSVRHTGNVLHNVIEGTYKVLESMPIVMERRELMLDINLNAEERHVFANAVKSLRWDGDKAHVNNDALLRPLRSSDRATDLWTTANILQEKVIRGGVRVAPIDQETHEPQGWKAQRAREVKSVSENVRLNTALWTLAEEMRKLKAA